MRGLLLRLSAVDSTAEAALRVIAYFDALVQHRATLEGLARAAAGLAECGVGLADDTTGRTLRIGADGRPRTDPAADAGRDEQVIVAGRVVGRVWLERPGEPALHDDIVLERFALAAASLWPGVDTEWDPAAIEIVVSSTADDLDRSRALRRIGLESRAPVRIVAFASADPDDATPSPRVHAAVRAATVPGPSPRSAVVGVRGVVVQDSTEPVPGPIEGAVLGIGPVVPAHEAPRSWSDASAALDLARAVPMLTGPTARSEELGSLLSLSWVPAEVSGRNSDVLALRAHAASGNDDDLRALEAFLAAGSLRGAGALLHRHHSSVAARLARVESALGIDLAAAQGLVRAQTALVLLRLSGV